MGKQAGQMVLMLNRYGKNAVQGIIMCFLYDYDANKFKSDWYFMDISGEVTRLTTYLQQYKYAGNFSEVLSPDEKNLSYGVHLSDNQEIIPSSTQILDLETLELMNTCQPIGNFDSVVWSPDSRYISYSRELEEESYRTLIMDIENRTISIVEENTYPVLWVKGNDR